MLVIAACSEDVEWNKDIPTFTEGPPISDGSATGEAAVVPAGDGSADCYTVKGAKLVVVSYWKTTDCSGAAIATNTYPVDYGATECHCWPGSSGQNSATKFSCGNNSLTFTQWTTYSCSGGENPAGTVKTVYTDTCTKDVPGALYAKITDFAGCQ